MVQFAFVRGAVLVAAAHVDARIHRKTPDVQSHLLRSSPLALTVEFAMASYFEPGYMASARARISAASAGRMKPDLMADCRDDANFLRYSARPAG